MKNKILKFPHKPANVLEYNYEQLLRAQKQRKRDVIMSLLFLAIFATAVCYVVVKRYF